MIDARMPWLSVGASRTDLSVSSSVSLLHSIYGSQASQLPFSDYSSEASLPVTRSEFLSPSVTAQRRQHRPKSSPAATLAAREQKRRPGSAVPRPGSARPRPGSALPRQRPSSGYPGGGGGAHRQRPRTALGVRRPSSSSSLVVEDVEDETARPSIRDTAPVHVTRVPEYFNFWEGKPLLQRDFGVKVHNRKAWQRPKSDYGSRYSLRKGEGEAKKGGRGEEGGWGLETLAEKDDSVGGSEEGKGRRGRLRGAGEESGAGDGGTGQDGDKSKDGGEGGLRDNRGSSRDLLDDHNRDRNKRGRGRGGSGALRDRWAHAKRGGWGEEDGGADADEDDYFKKSSTFLSTSSTVLSHCDSTKAHPISPREGMQNQWRGQGARHTPPPALRVKTEQPSQPNYEKAMASVSWMDASSSSHRSTRFELPMDIRQLEGMSPLQYLSKHCIISNRRMAHCSKVFTKLDKDRDSKITRQEVVVGLVEVHYHCITPDQATSVLELVEFGEDTLVDLRLFAALCCLAERMLALHFLPLARREVIETVDFEALEWKLRDCRIGSQLRTLFTQL